MNVQMALIALEQAGIEGKGTKSARQLLAKDPWPTEIELPRLDGQFVDPAELIGALAEDFTAGRATAADLRGRVADIAMMRVGAGLWHTLYDRVKVTHEYRARALLAGDWNGIQKELDRREAAARKQLSAAHKELAAAAKRLDVNEVTSRVRAVHAGRKAAEAWDNRAQANGQLRALHGLRHQLAEHAGLGERPQVEWWEGLPGTFSAA